MARERAKPNFGQKVTKDQWAAVDWSRTNVAIARDLGVTDARVSQVRAKRAPDTARYPRGRRGSKPAAAPRQRPARPPEPDPPRPAADPDPRPHVVTLEPGAVIEIRAGDSEAVRLLRAQLADANEDADAITRVAKDFEEQLDAARKQLDAAISERVQAQHERDTANAKVAAARAQPAKPKAVADPATKRELKKATAALETARADLATVTADRDQLRTELRQAQAAALTIGTHEAGAAAAERDVALAELERIKAAQALRPELLAALGAAVREHPELPSMLSGTAKVDMFLPAGGEPGRPLKDGS